MHGIPARFLASDPRVLYGARVVVNVSAPAAGSEWSLPVPAGHQYRVLCGTTTLVTSATVANRFWGYDVVVAGVTVATQFDTSAQTASLTAQTTYTTAPVGVTGVSAPNQRTVQLPDFWLCQGDTLQSHTIGLQATDQYGAVNLLVEDCWFTNQDLSDYKLDEWQREQELERILTTQLDATPYGG